jgi:hypothetical protein
MSICSKLEFLGHMSPNLIHSSHHHALRATKQVVFSDDNLESQMMK